MSTIQRRETRARPTSASSLASRLKIGDKVLALLIWFGDWAASLFFQLKVFGHANLPWNL